jgi:hypothetical protein
MLAFRRWFRLVLSKAVQNPPVSPRMLFASLLPVKRPRNEKWLNAVIEEDEGCDYFLFFSLQWQ